MLKYTSRRLWNVPRKRSGCVWVWQHKRRHWHRPRPKLGAALGEVGWTRSTAFCEKFSVQISICHIHGAKAYPEPYPVKEAAIRKMLVPTDKASVHRFLGVCHCLSIFFDNLSETVLPLRNLAKDDSAFLWSESHETAFKKYRRLNNGAPLLWPTPSCDTSRYDTTRYVGYTQQWVQTYFN